MNKKKIEEAKELCSYCNYGCLCRSDCEDWKLYIDYESLYFKLRKKLCLAFGIHWHVKIRSVSICRICLRRRP